jgi:plasmid stabilization system protein ParE
MTGRIYYTPEAAQQLDDLDEWITAKGSAQTALDFVAALLDPIDGILAFPLAGRPRDDIRPGMRTTVFRRRALVAYEVDESSGDVNIIGVFSGGQDWGAALAPGDHGSDQG